METVIKISGQWDEGIILDKYTVKSVFIDYDAFGEPLFDNTYSAVGQLLHDMKYNGHINTSDKIVDMYFDYLKSWIKGKDIDIIIPVPPSKTRLIQPVFTFGETLSSRLNIPYSDSILQKTDDVETKNIPKEERNLSGKIKQLKFAKRRCNILLIDDFYSTGQTSNECTAVLKNDPLVDKIYYLAIAKTKN